MLRYKVVQQWAVIMLFLMMKGVAKVAVVMQARSASLKALCGIAQKPVSPNAAVRLRFGVAHMGNVPSAEGITSVKKAARAVLILTVAKQRQRA